MKLLKMPLLEIFQAYIYFQKHVFFGNCTILRLLTFFKHCLNVNWQCFSRVLISSKYLDLFLSTRMWGALKNYVKFLWKALILVLLLLHPIVKIMMDFSFSNPTRTFLHLIFLHWRTEFFKRTKKLILKVSTHQGLDWRCYHKVNIWRFVIH